MAKIIKLRNRELTPAGAQREWLQRNEVAVVQRWDFPKGTWMQTRLAYLQAERAAPKMIPWKLS